MVFYAVLLTVPSLVLAGTIPPGPDSYAPLVGPMGPTHMRPWYTLIELMLAQHVGRYETATLVTGSHRWGHFGKLHMYLLDICVSLTGGNDSRFLPRRVLPRQRQATRLLLVLSNSTVTLLL